MTLSCECDYDGDVAWYWNGYDFGPLRTKRSRRCKSCRTVIQPGVVCLSIGRYRPPHSDIEERICGDEVPLADWWLCEPCGDIYASLVELGYCVDPAESMAEQLGEYHEIHGIAVKEKKA